MRVLFPVWLMPIQAVLIPIADRHVEYSQKVAAELKQAGLRVRVDDRAERMNAKIRDAQTQKIPNMLVVGDKEMESGQVALRLRNGENPGPMPIAAFWKGLRRILSKKFDRNILLAIDEML